MFVKLKHTTFYYCVLVYSSIISWYTLSKSSWSAFCASFPYLPYPAQSISIRNSPTRRRFVCLSSQTLAKQMGIPHITQRIRAFMRTYVRRFFISCFTIYFLCPLLLRASHSWRSTCVSKCWRCCRRHPCVGKNRSTPKDYDWLSLINWNWINRARMVRRRSRWSGWWEGESGEWEEVKANGQIERTTSVVTSSPWPIRGVHIDYGRPRCVCVWTSWRCALSVATSITNDCAQCVSFLCFGNRCYPYDDKARFWWLCIA